MTEKGENRLVLIEISFNIAKLFGQKSYFQSMRVVFNRLNVVFFNLRLRNSLMAIIYCFKGMSKYLRTRNQKYYHEIKCTFNYNSINEVHDR